MKERPILFSAPMVRAILAGTKTQTRRVVKQQPPEWGKSLRSPYGLPGDRLWVRETYMDLGACYLYRADHTAEKERALVAPGQRWCPSIHMPRSASRITLEVTAVRVERLQDISEADAVAEGVEWNRCPTQQTQRSVDAQRAASRIGMAAHYEARIDYIGGYRWLWESINGPSSWDANPWVWVVEFRRVDAMRGEG